MFSINHFVTYHFSGQIHGIKYPITLTYITIVLQQVKLGPEHRPYEATSPSAKR